MADDGQPVLDTGCGILDAGYLTLDGRQRALLKVFSILASALKASRSGHFFQARSCRRPIVLIVNSLLFMN